VRRKVLNAIELESPAIESTDDEAD